MHVGMGAFFQNPGRARSDADVGGWAWNWPATPRPRGSTRCGRRSTTSPTITCVRTSPSSSPGWRRGRPGSSSGRWSWCCRGTTPSASAEEVSVLDHMSGGRVLLGIGRGLGRVEFDGFRLEMGESRGRFTEYAQAILSGLETGKIRPTASCTASRRSRSVLRHWPRSGRRSTPRPSPRRRRGILAEPRRRHDDHRPEAVGDGRGRRRRLPGRSTARFNGEEAPEADPGQWVAVHESAAAAEEMFEQWIMGYCASTLVHYEFANQGLADIPGYEYYGKLAARIAKHGADDFCRFLAGLQVWGTPAVVTEQPPENVRRIDAAGVVGVFNYAGMPDDVARANIGLFADQVMPALHGIDTGAPPGAARDRRHPLKDMDRATDIGLVRRFFALHETRADELAPATYRQPAADYTSAEHLDRERRTLFCGTPLLAGLSADIPEAGDYLTLSSGAGSAAHRGPGRRRRGPGHGQHLPPPGVQLLDGRGRAARCIVCPYHSWTYDLTGRLTAQPGAGAAFADVTATGSHCRPSPSPRATASSSSAPGPTSRSTSTPCCAASGRSSTPTSWRRTTTSRPAPTSSRSTGRW